MSAVKLRLTSTNGHNGIIGSRFIHIKQVEIWAKYMNSLLDSGQKATLNRDCHVVGGKRVRPIGPLGYVKAASLPDPKQNAQKQGTGVGLLS